MNEVVVGTIKGVVKGVISQVPIAGPIVTAIYDEVVAASLLKRRGEWEETIEQRLEALEDESIVEKLIGNESFVSCLIQATREALATHQHEKVSRLANAVINSINSELEDDKKQIFIQWIEHYSETHILILEFLDRPLLLFMHEGVVPSSANQRRSFKELLQEVYPHKLFDEEIANIAVRELYAGGLIKTTRLQFDSLNDMFTNGFTTQIAKEFLLYIQDSSKENAL